jgi:hypothetical protein
MVPMRAPALIGWVVMGFPLDQALVNDMQAVSGVQAALVAQPMRSAPVVLVHRGDDACLGWWVKCGHFDITYPDYHKYYHNLSCMAKEIKSQNSAMRPYWDLASSVTDNLDLCAKLKIATPPEQYQQNYADSKVRVKVL